MTLELTPTHHVSCPRCGIDLEDTPLVSEYAEKQIIELQVQIQLLQTKLRSAEKLADFKDEILPLPEETNQRDKSFHLFNSCSLSSFIGYSTISDKVKETVTASPPSSQLIAELRREKSLRKAAEGKLSESSAEVEELSAELFMRANEMVAVERKERAKLESRVGFLEQKDFEKNQRLEKLESAIRRIERVQDLLKFGVKVN